MEVARIAIEANRDISLNAVEAVKEIAKAALDQRPAARLFASPVGETAATAAIGGPQAFQITPAVKKIIDHEEATEIGPSTQYSVMITELDVKTGSAKLSIYGDDSDDRYSASIVDPVVHNAHSPYSVSLDGQEWIKVMAKAHLRAGQIVKFTVSDTVQN